MSSTSKIQLIIGSTRPARIGSQVAQWLTSLAEDNPGFEIEVLDLKEINLPFLNEPVMPSMQMYSLPHTKKWSQKIASGNGYIWLTPEYNNGYPAPLKNAIDYLYHEWKDKPVLIVSYGFAGALQISEAFGIFPAKP